MFWSPTKELTKQNEDPACSNQELMQPNKCINKIFFLKKRKIQLGSGWCVCADQDPLPPARGPRGADVPVPTDQATLAGVTQRMGIFFCI